MKIIDIKPRSPEWHQWRSEGIGASESSIILAKSPYKTQWQLWAEKCGFCIPASLEHNPNVQRGIRLEPIARAYLEELHQELLFPLCAESTNYPFIRASFDGINSNGEPVEIKCPSFTIFEEVKTLKEGSDTYQYYQIQVQHQLLVSDSQRGWLVFYYQDDNDQVDTVIFEIKRNEQLIDTIINHAETFWHSVTVQKPPQKCPQRDNFIPEGNASKEWEDLATQYHMLDSEAKTLNQKLDEVKLNMSVLQKSFLNLMQNFAHAEYAGIKIIRYWSQGQVDYPRLLNDLGHTLPTQQVEQYRKSASEKIRFTTIPQLSTLSDSDITVTEDMLPECQIATNISDIKPTNETDIELNACSVKGDSVIINEIVKASKPRTRRKSNQVKLHNLTETTKLISAQPTTELNSDPNALSIEDGTLGSVKDRLMDITEVKSNSANDNSIQTIFPSHYF